MSEPSSSNDKICGICEEKQSKYCCPKCEILYCSLDCYKSEKHMTCSETFYRDCVNEELTFFEPDDESKKMINNLLKKMYKKDCEDVTVDDEFLETMEGLDKVDSDDDDEADLHQRILGLDLNNTDALWNALTTDEKNEFEAIVNQGDITSIMPQWDPWWKNKWETNIVDLEEVEAKMQEMLDKCPAVLKMPKLSSLTSVPAAPAVKYNMINVLGSYAFLARYFNGDLEPIETTIYLFEICANLDANSNFDDTSVAIASIQQRCLQSQFIKTDEDSLDVMSADTFLILQGPSSEYKAFYCKAALSHLHSILTDAKTATRSANKDELTDDNTKNRGDNKNTETTEANTKTKSKEDANKNTTKDKSPKDTNTEDSTNNSNKNKDSNKTSEFSKKFPDHKMENLPKIDTNKVRKSLKKIEYYLSFLEDCDSRLNK